MQMQLVINEANYLLPLKDGTTHQVTDQEVQFFQTVYPGLDIEQQIREMIGWTVSNPARQKTRRGIKRFINNWLSQAFKSPQNLTHANPSTRSTTLADDLTGRSWAM